MGFIENTTAPSKMVKVKWMKLRFTAEEEDGKHRTGKCSLVMKMV
jgi:hypothetical protein